MAVLKPTGLSGRVVALLSNEDDTDLSTARRESLNLDLSGVVGDTHQGLTRKSCSRVKHQYPLDTVIRNTRQISIVSVEELSLIAESMGVPEVKPEWIGCNMVVQGLSNFSAVPPSSRLIFDNGVSLVVDMENEPCRHPGELVEEHYPGKGKKFAKSAMHRRGITGWVEREGQVKVDQILQLHVPTARAFSIT